MLGFEAFAKPESAPSLIQQISPSNHLEAQRSRSTCPPSIRTLTLDDSSLFSCAFSSYSPTSSSRSAPCICNRDCNPHPSTTNHGHLPNSTHFHSEPTTAELHSHSSSHLFKDAASNCNCCCCYSAPTPGSRCRHHPSDLLNRALVSDLTLRNPSCEVFRSLLCLLQIPPSKALASSTTTGKVSRQPLHRPGHASSRRLRRPDCRPLGQRKDKFPPQFESAARPDLPIREVVSTTAFCQPRLHTRDKIPPTRFIRPP